MTELKKGERRYDDHGPFRLMAHADGYVMVRRPGATPSVKTVEDWLALPKEDDRK